ncbi:MAG: hypothetical protein L0Z50_27720 [Verrucomicrobiales bacterium]|nr:hypothetical protein [Verrucomicrobiales bacterium]
MKTDDVTDEQLASLLKLLRAEARNQHQHLGPQECETLALGSESEEKELLRQRLNECAECRRQMEHILASLNYWNSSEGNERWALLTQKIVDSLPQFAQFQVLPSFVQRTIVDLRQAFRDAGENLREMLKLELSRAWEANDDVQVPSEREVWTWESPDKTLRGHMTIGRYRDRTVRFSSKSLALDGCTIEIFYGRMARREVFRRAGDEVATSINFARDELPEDYSPEIIRIELLEKNRDHEDHDPQSTL